LDGTESVQNGLGQEAYCLPARRVRETGNPSLRITFSETTSFETRFSKPPFENRLPETYLLETEVPETTS
jgi:hypothetical protein